MMIQNIIFMSRQVKPGGLRFKKSVFSLIEELSFGSYYRRGFNPDSPRCIDQTSDPMMTSAANRLPSRMATHGLT